MKRFFAVTSLALTLSGIAIFGWLLLRPAPTSHGAITVRGGTPMNICVAGSEPHYCQNDPKWADERIGGSGESIGSVGCTLCCVSMAFDHFGIDGNDPGTLNATLIANEGYTDQGLIQWDSVAHASARQVPVTVHASPSHQVIDADLKAGRLVIAKFYLPMGIPHWVLICGKRGDDYLIKDPARHEAGLIPFSKRASSIVSIRTLGI